MPDPGSGSETAHPSTGALRPLLTQAGFTPVHPEAAEAEPPVDRDGELMAQDARCG